MINNKSHRLTYKQIKQYITIPVFLLGIMQLLSSCQGLSERSVHISGAVSGLETGELVSCSRSAANPDSMETVTTSVTDGGKFILDIPIKPGQGDWYRIWIGSTPGPHKEVTLYLDSGEVHITGKNAGIADAAYSGGKCILEYQDFLQLLARNNAMAKANSAQGIKTENIGGITMAQWVASHPSSALGTALLEKYRMGPMPVDSVIASFSRRNPLALNNLPAKRLQEWIKITSDVAPGKAAPGFIMADTIGKVVSLKDFHGKYVLLDFWASWCVPCRAENPNVVKAYNQYKDKGFTVLGVSLDQAEAKTAWLNAIHKDGLTWTHISDLKYFDNTAAKLYHIEAIPANFLINPKGIIIARNLRGDELEKKLSEVMPK